MKRAPLFVFAGTVAGLAGILSFHTHPQTSGLAGSAENGSVNDGSTHPAKRHDPSVPRSGASTPASHSGHTSRASRASHSLVRSVTGAREQYGYGVLAVRVTVRGGHIVNVSVPFIRTAEQYSQQLASEAIPTLRNEVLAAQSANINGVSGATYTSQAYAKSLQAALDKLHLA
jgi:uncharacterized protein with FMN-binding domain